MKRISATLLFLALLSVALLAQRYTAPGKVVNSRHDFSVGSAGSTYNAAAPAVSPQNQRCVFCHTPHHANPKAPLWNHAVSGTTYTTYTSTTLTATMAQPSATDNTRLCVSCHDGTVALGNTVNNGNIAMANSVTTLPINAGSTYTPTRNTNLGSSLADDHPVAFTQTSPLMPALPQVQTPPAGDAVALEAGKLQCTGCHNPHDEAVDPIEKRFLRKANSGSTICTTCHKLQGSGGGVNAWNWLGGPSSDHQTHTNAYTAVTNNPGGTDSSYLGSHTSYMAVNSNGCEACHRPHTAHAAQRLLKGQTSQVCFQCHDGNVTTNIKNPPSNTVVQNMKTAFLGKTYIHPGGSVSGSSGASDAGHDPAETLPVATRHAACDDCHNPHAAKGYESAGGVFPVPPAMPSTLWGVRGITSAGTPRNRTAGNDDAQHEYEICFKCHGSSVGKRQTADITQTGIGYGRLPMRNKDFAPGSCSSYLTTRADVRLEFADHTTNVSFHPVVDPLNHTATYLNSATEVPSLRAFVKDASGADITARPLGAASIIYCTDCHNNDTGRNTVLTRLGAPVGPHGSGNMHILERTYVMDSARGSTGTCSTGGGSSGMGYNVANFKLCDKCHDITKSTMALGNVFGNDPQLHNYHMSASGDANTSCSTCHDPHASTSAKLISFDKAVVGPSSSGPVNYTHTGLHHGSCTLTCHGYDHHPRTY